MGIWTSILAELAKRLPQKVTKIGPVVLCVVGVGIPYYAAFARWGCIGPLAPILLILAAWLLVHIEGERPK